MKSRYQLVSFLCKIRYKIKNIYRKWIWIILLLCIAMENRGFRQCLHRMAFKNTYLESFFTFWKIFTFFKLNDQEYLILKQVYYNHFGCFNLTKIPLHRELFLRVSWRRVGSGGKAGGSWVGRGEA